MIDNYNGQLLKYTIVGNSIELIALRHRIYSDEVMENDYTKDEITVNVVKSKDMTDIERILKLALDDNFVIVYDGNAKQYLFELEGYYDEESIFIITALTHRVIEYTIQEWKEKYHQLNKEYYSRINKYSKENLCIRNKINKLKRSIEQDYDNSCKKINHFEKKNCDHKNLEKVRNEVYHKILNKLNIFLFDE